jgi:DNA-binding beta-propeller fold protein YncE
MRHYAAPRALRAIAAALLLLPLAPSAPGRAQAEAPPAPPQYQVDPFWPKPLPNRWGIGQAAGVATDGRDHVWVIHRPRTMTEDERGAALTPPRSACCFPAPSVLEFDPDGNLVQAWGGPGHHPSWPEGEHGIHVDHQDNVWIAGNGPNDHVLLKFTRDGRFLLQIGKHHETGGSNDTERLGRPADAEVDPATNEVYVADGYANRRVVVFDAATGAYRRHWGAYGERPQDGPLPAYQPGQPPARTFRNPVHCARLARDGLLYVCDRANDRVQVFRKDGAFVREFIVAPETLGSGSVWDLDFLPDARQSVLLAADGSNNHVWMLGREDGAVLGLFGRNGRNAGDFHWVHNLAVDSRGNIFTTEVDTGKRAQRFRLVTQLPR